VSVFGSRGCEGRTAAPLVGEVGPGDSHSTRGAPGAPSPAATHAPPRSLAAANGAGAVAWCEGWEGGGRGVSPCWAASCRRLARSAGAGRERGAGEEGWGWGWGVGTPLRSSMVVVVGYCAYRGQGPCRCSQSGQRRRSRGSPRGDAPLSGPTARLLGINPPATPAAAPRACRQQGRPQRSAHPRPRSSRGPRCSLEADLLASLTASAHSAAKSRALCTRRCASEGAAPVAQYGPPGKPRVCQRRQGHGDAWMDRVRERESSEEGPLGGAGAGVGAGPAARGWAGRRGKGPLSSLLVPPLLLSGVWGPRGARQP